jgi:hypothetical protein
MALNYSSEIYQAIEDFLMDDDWKYDTSEKDGIFRAGVNLNCKVKNIRLLINVTSDSFSVISTLPIGADDDNKAAVAEFITRANYGLMHGNFELDYSDGEIRYRTSLYCGEDTAPDSEQVRKMIYVNALMVERYGDGLMQVIFGVQTPAEVIHQIEE